MPYSVNGSKNDLYPEQIRFEEDKNCRGRTRLEKGLLLLVAVLFIIAATLAVLFAVYYVKSKDDENSKATLAVLFGMYYVKSKDEENSKVCLSMGCITTATRMSSKMDRTADPCHNFDQYACGAFYRGTLIPDDRNKVTSFTVVNDKNEKVIRRILEAAVKPDDRGFVKKMKTYYQNCMDIDTIESIGLSVYLNSTFANEWPTLYTGWDPTTFNLNDVIAHYEKEFVEPIFIYIVSTNFEDSTKHKLHLAQAGLGLPQEYMKFPRNDSTLMAYERYYEEIALELGAEPGTAKTDAKELVDLEVKLSKIMVTREEMIDLNAINNPTTIANMTLDYPFIDFHRALQAAFDIVGKTIPEDLPINNRHPKYFDNLKAVIDETDSRVLMNRFGFQYARLNVGSLTKRMREIRAEFLKVISGKKEQDPRWRQCISGTKYFIGDAVSKAFVNETFSEDSKKYMDTMIENLKESFAGLLRENEWMEAKTKEAAFLKLNHMRRKIGFPDNNYSDDFIARKYENYTVYTGEHYKTAIEAFKHKNKEGLRKLDKGVDKEKWMMSPSQVNAYYSGVLNEIGFPAGILQSPYFSEQAPSSVNYGAIGGIIGHEITHGFDQSGSQLDHKGNLKNWWQPKDLAEFKNRTQCVIDHYADFKLEEIGMNLNGELTAGENTADIGGLKESYRAYKAYSVDQPEELPLPGLGMTTDQQFFLAFAQLWCSKQTNAELKDNVLSGVHSAGRFRIKGPFQNNYDFPRVFNCPAGSPMNPVKKCVVW